MKYSDYKKQNTTKKLEICRESRGLVRQQVLKQGLTWTRPGVMMTNRKGYDRKRRKTQEQVMIKEYID